MIKLIVAHGINGEIGGDNKLLWSLPKDLKLFKEKTNKGGMIIGRKTRESLPTYPYGLPNRETIVVTSQNKGDIDNEKTGAYLLFSSMKFAKRCLRISSRMRVDWIAGGKGVYEELEHLADEIHVTEVEQAFTEADTFYKPNLAGYTEDVSQRVDVSSDTIKATVKVFIKDK